MVFETYRMTSIVIPKGMTPVSQFFLLESKTLDQYFNLNGARIIQILTAHIPSNIFTYQNYN